MTEAKKAPANRKPKSTKAVAVIPGNLSLDDHIKLAISKGMLDTVERLLAVRRELKAEWARDRYFEALAQFQKECPIILKRNAADDGRFWYAPMPDIVEATKGLLEKHGFSTTYKRDNSMLKDGFVGVTAIGHHVDGHSEEATAIMPTDVASSGSGKSIMNKQQAVGSARMYALRGAHCDLYGIVTADWDDDAQGAGKGENGKPKAKKQGKSQESATELCDECLGLLKTGAFKDHAQQVMSLEKKITELHKEKNVAALIAMRDSIKRQQAAYAKEQVGLR